MQQKIKLLFICFVFFFSFAFFGINTFNELGKVNNTQDFLFHFQELKTPGKDYLPLYHFSFSFFPLNELQFYLINLFLVCFILPFLLYKITKTWLSGLLLFALDLPFIIIHGATYPHLFVLIFFLIYLLNRNIIAFLSMAFLSALTHNEGLILFAAVFLAETINYLIHFEFKQNGYFPVGFIAGTKIMTLRNLIAVFFNALPFPFLYFSFNSLKKNLFYCILISFSLLGAFTNDIRALSIAQILILISAAEIIKEKPQKIKNAVIVFAFIQAAYFLLNYLPVTWKLIAFNA